MTGEAFEALVCGLFKRMGYWALNIPKNRSGAQPFDVLAIKGNLVFAIDCKVCSQPRFPLARVEDNQWLSMGFMKDRTEANLGFMCYFDGDIYFVPYLDVVIAQNEGRASIKLNDSNRWLTKNDIMEGN